MLAVSGLGLVLVAWLHYLASIPREKVPKNPTLHLVVFALGSALALVAVALTWQQGAWVAPLVIAAIATGLAGFFVYLLRQAPLPDGKLVVSLGDPLPSIEALSSGGALRKSTDFAGHRLLIKFFRGHW